MIMDRFFYVHVVLFVYCIAAFSVVFIPHPLYGDDILGGVARTVEDIGGQIVGNQASRNNHRLEQRMAEEQTRNSQGSQEEVAVISPNGSQGAGAIQIVPQNRVGMVPTVTPLAIPHVGIR